MNILKPNKHNSGTGKIMDYSKYTHKKCSKCNKIKPVNDFVKEKRKSGIGWRYRSQCKECKKPYNKEFARKKRRRIGIKEKTLMSLDEQLKHQRTASRKHYYSHLIFERLRTKKWKKNNTEKQRFIEKRRRALKNNSEGSHTYKEWIELKLKYGNICVMCQKTEPQIKLTQDHIIPLTKNGTDYISNIQPLCFSCNASKQDKIINIIETELFKFDYST